MPKKTFKDELNPALQFISDFQEEENQESQNNIPEDVSMKKNSLYTETKSKRFQLLMQPSLYSRLKVMSDEKETSINDLIHKILDQYTQKNP
jgi:predicted HicB family RNase H-like nuclease